MLWTSVPDKWVILFLAGHCLLSSFVHPFYCQGYLSRALSSFPLSMNVIALDFSEVQTKGAKRRGSNIQRRLAKSGLKRGADNCPFDTLENIHTPANRGGTPSVTAGSLTHEMISITPQTLHTSVSRWISAQSTTHTTPVMFVALHACGTLTPDILRCFIANQDNTHLLRDRRSTQSWHAAALVVVGCCYNLMSPDLGVSFPVLWRAATF